MLSLAPNEQIEMALSNELLNLILKLDKFLGVVAMVHRQNLFRILCTNGAHNFLASGSCPLISIGTFALGAFSGV